MSKTEQIIQAIQTKGEATLKDITAATQIGTNTVRGTVNNLTKKGKLVRVKKATYAVNKQEVMN